MRSITDRPGRYFAIFIFAPLLLFCGLYICFYNKYIKTISTILITLSIILFFYELFWILSKPLDAMLLE